MNQPYQGLKSRCDYHRVMHTASHHNDIYLGYFPIVQKCLQTGKHEIVYFTSGENGIADD